MIDYAWLIPALPAVAFALILFFGKRTPGRGAPIGILAVGAAWVISVVVGWHFVSGGEPVSHQFHYMDAGFFHLNVGE